MPVLNRQPLGFITHKVSKNAVVLHSSLILNGFFNLFFFWKGGGCSKGTCQCLSRPLTEQSNLWNHSLSNGVAQQESLAPSVIYKEAKSDCLWPSHISSMLHLDIFTYDTVSKSRWNWPMYATFATFNFHNILRMLQHNFRDFVIAHSRNKIYPKNDSFTANWNHSSYIVLYCDHAQTSDWLIIQIDRQNLLCEELHIQLEWQTSELIMNPRFFCFHF